MSKADSLFDWWRKVLPSLRPNPFSYSEREDVELAHQQVTLREKLEGLQATLEKPFSESREVLRRQLQAAYSGVAEWLERVKERFNTGQFESDYGTRTATVRLTWRPILPRILEWIEELKSSILEAKKQPLTRPFLALVGVAPQSLDVPDFHPVCGFWCDNIMNGGYPWKRRKWNAVVGPIPQVEVVPDPCLVAASLAEMVWVDHLESLEPIVRKAHRSVTNCPWTIAHVLCELAKPDGGVDAPDMAQASIDRICWATSLHVHYRRWLHAEGARRGVVSPIDRTECYPSWYGFAEIIGDDQTSSIGGHGRHRRACYFAFLLDELSSLWEQRKSTKVPEREYKKPWHGAALAFLKLHPHALAADIARAVGVSRSTITRDETMRQLLSGRKELRKGSSDGKGNVDGVVDPVFPEI